MIFFPSRTRKVLKAKAASMRCESAVVFAFSFSPQRDCSRLLSLDQIPHLSLSRRSASYFVFFPLFSAFKRFPLQCTVLLSFLTPCMSQVFCRQGCAFPESCRHRSIAPRRRTFSVLPPHDSFFGVEVILKFGFREGSKVFRHFLPLAGL